MASKPQVIALMGPTAAGKTDLALGLAEALNGEIISVDSALVYQGMDIGTAKPSPQEQARVPHHLIDIRDPSQSYSAADFCRDAHQAIAQILAAGKTPILAGGTMLYFKTLLEGLSPMPPSQEAVRSAIEAEAAQLGWPAMHQLLASVDPLTAAKLHPNHSARIGRALEVWRISGVPMSQWQGQAEGGLASEYQWVQLAVAPRERSLLHQRIALRFDAMLKQGFIEEVQALRQRPDLHADLPALRAVGYRQVWQFLDGQLAAADLPAVAVAATRQLAKRQLTWLRGWHDLRWVDTQDQNARVLNNEEILQKTLQLVAAAPI
jgi:tRNA dimethylallyltransferase